MKLLVTADDYGMTVAVTDGIIACIREGVLTQTGLFTNMPSTEYAVKRMMEEFPDFCLGIDINFSTGYPVSDPKLIPTMVQENGAFLTSRMHRNLDKTNPQSTYGNRVHSEEKPDYLGGHAYSSDEIRQAHKDLCEKYGILPKAAIVSKVELEPDAKVSKEWTSPKIKEDGTFDFGMEVQIGNNPLEMFKNGKLPYFEKALKENKGVHIHSHAGFVDHELVKLSSFNMIRMMEAELIMSKELKEWVKNNDVELVSAKDFDRL